MENITLLLAFKLFLYYGSWLSFPLLYWFIKKRWFIMVILSLLFIYARFIEPNLIFLNHYKIETGFKAKYALISDMHLGIYNNETLLERVVDKINQTDIEALLIAGDLTYEPQLSNMKTLFAPLKRVNVPVYIVFGNHDCEKPGPKIRDRLEKILTDWGLFVLNNKATTLNGVTLLGLGSHWANDDNITLLNHYAAKEHLVVLTHNPDTTLDYMPHHTPDITLTGHTHGGQVRIPYLYPKVIPVKGDIAWDQGLYNFGEEKVFVSSGLGQIGLPLRFLIPPTIDILEFY